MGAYCPRKGSLGFRFKKVKNRIINGNNELALWFHKVGMDHQVDTVNFMSRTQLEFIDTAIKGYKFINNATIYSLEQVLSQNLDKTRLRTLLILKPKFQKTEVLREIGFIQSIDMLYEKISVLGTKLKAIAPTKGKGFNGVIKTRGIKKGKRKRVRSNKARHIGSIGGRTGHVSWRAPMGCNMGNAKRTYLVTTINNTFGVSPYCHYGYISNKNIAIKGSIPGNIKQLVKIVYKGVL